MRIMRPVVLALAFAVFSPIAAAADDSAGLQILIDMQDPNLVSKTFCVNASKLYSVDAQVCVAPNIKMTCSAVDPADAGKGVKWIIADEKTPSCK